MTKTNPTTPRDTISDSGWVNVWGPVINRGWGVWRTREEAVKVAKEWLIELSKYPNIPKPTYINTIPLCEWVD